MNDENLWSTKTEEEEKDNKNAWNPLKSSNPLYTYKPKQQTNKKTFLTRKKRNKRNKKMIKRIVI